MRFRRPECGWDISMNVMSWRQKTRRIPLLRLDLRRSENRRDVSSEAWKCRRWVPEVIGSRDRWSIAVHVTTVLGRWRRTSWSPLWFMTSFGLGRRCHLADDGWDAAVRCDVGYRVRFERDLVRFRNAEQDCWWLPMGRAIFRIKENIFPSKSAGPRQFSYLTIILFCMCAIYW